MRKVLADGGVGSLNHMLDPRDVVIPNDFIDLTHQAGHLRSRRPPAHHAPARYAPTWRATSISERASRSRRVFKRGVYLVTDGPRFESVAEVDYMRRLGGDIVGQSLAPEVFLARDIGACYAGIYIVVNYAEGVVRDWEHDELKAVFFEESETIARIVLDAISARRPRRSPAAAWTSASRACSACPTSGPPPSRASRARRHTCRSVAPLDAPAWTSRVAPPARTRGSCLIVTADWVLPVSAPPIEHGAVAVREGCVVEVGSAADVCSRWLDDSVEDFEGCIVAPGLVNAHTHLALSVAVGLVPPGPFHPWLAQITKVVLGLSHAEFGDSACGGALECLKSGTTAVGDIVYGDESLRRGNVAWGWAARTSGRSSASRPPRWPTSLERRGYPTAPIVADRVRAGLSPHAPYSSGPALIRAAADEARTRGEVFAIHVSEAAGEVELIEAGTGPFTVQAERLAHGFEVPGTTPVAYLDSLGVLAGATCVHAVQVTEADIELLAAKARAVVLCPRSNAYLGNGAPPVDALRRSGVTLAIGTDSSASNRDLDLFAEARAVRELDPDMDAETLLTAMTAGGATALGLEGRIGALVPGAAADLIAVEASLRPGQSPADAFIEAGGAGTVRAVMCGGEWRVSEGRFVFDTDEIEAASAAARAHAVGLLDQASPR